VHRQRLSASLCFAAIVAIAPAHAVNAPVLGDKGLGELRFGMSLKAINAKLNKPIVAPAASRRATPNCYYVAGPELPGIAFVFVDDRLRRIDAATSAIATAAGVTVGDSEDRAVDRIGAARRIPLDYQDDGFALLKARPGAPTAIVFQFRARRLTNIIAGDKRAVRWAEGCD
jgi:hypothetical protein